MALMPHVEGRCGLIWCVPGDEVEIETKALHVDHKGLNQCGEAQWYEPFVELNESTLGIALEHSYQGRTLSTRWSDPNKQSAFFGRFEF